MIQIPVNISLAIPQQGRDTRNFVSFDGFTGLLSRASLWVPFLLFNFVASQLVRIKSYYWIHITLRHSANCPYLNERAMKNNPSKIFSSLLALSNINFSVSTTSTSIWLLSEARLIFFSSMIASGSRPASSPVWARLRLGLSRRSRQTVRGLAGRREEVWDVGTVRVYRWTARSVSEGGTTTTTTIIHHGVLYKVQLKGIKQTRNNLDTVIFSCFKVNNNKKKRYRS